MLATAVAPSWTQIGKLGAIAVIRTALNYFLARKIKEEEKATSEAVPFKTGLRIGSVRSVYRGGSGDEKTTQGSACSPEKNISDINT